LISHPATSFEELRDSDALMAEEKDGPGLCECLDNLGQRQDAFPMPRHTLLRFHFSLHPEPRPLQLLVFFPTVSVAPYPA